MSDWMTGIDETYPNGRHIYFEGVNLEAFIKAVESLGGDIHQVVSATIPPGKVEEWYRLSDTEGIDWGT